ncbi:MAG: hypothetical protein LBH93_00140 [Chitinispirillales bacterium]|jgi:hypothetical protein|nr:hypothetical protein [Chitinispirillales bacterium]
MPIPKITAKTAAICISAMIAALASPPFAGAGGRPLRALSLPVSAASLGLGEVSATGAMDASDVFRFPANTALAGGGQFIGGGSVSGDTSASYFAAALPIFSSGALGLFAQSAPAAEPPVPNVFGFSFAKYYPEYGYGFGVSASFYNDDFWGGEELYGALGADLRFDPIDGVLFGHAYFHSAGMLARANGFRRRIAERYGFAANYRPDIGLADFLGVSVGAGVRKTTWEGPIEAGVSAECGAWGMLFARLGYENAVNAPLRVSGLSAGLGVAYANFGVDAGYRLGAAGGTPAVWSVDAKAQIEGLKKRGAGENLALARGYYDRGMFAKSRLYAERALVADSTRWDAGALFLRSDSEVRRAGSVALIYGGNSRGTVIPYPPSADALGGLSRYAALVAELREANPVNFTVDVGNLLSVENDKLKVEFAASYYDAAGFDVIAPGIGELAMNPARLTAEQKRKTPVIVTNFNDNDAATGVKSSVLLTSDGYSLYLLNVVTDAAPKNSKIKLNLEYSIAGLKSLLNGKIAAGADLRAVVIHGTRQEVTRLAEALPELDVVIAANLAERFDTPQRVGNTLILSAGAENKFAGCLYLKFFDNRKIPAKGKAKSGAKNVRRPRTKTRFTAENKLFPVHQEIEPDSAVENVTRLVGAAVVVDRSENPNALVPVQGVIPHLSDRGAGPQAFLKVAQSKGEYPLGDDIFYCRQPVLSSVGNRAAFIYGKPDSKNGKLRMVDLGLMTGRTLSSNNNVLEAAFSPVDGFLYYIEADRGRENGAIRKTKMYMNDEFTVLGKTAATRSDLSVSPDGATLLFCSKLNGGRWEIYAIDTSAAATPTQLTDGKADCKRPRLSPDGRYVAYLSNLTGFGGQMDLWIYDRSAAKHRQLTFNANAQDISWGDDPETIYLSAGANLRTIFQVDVWQGAVTELIEPARSVGAIKTWGENTPRFIRYMDRPKIVYTREYVGGKRLVYWYDIWDKKDEKMYAAGEWDEWTE